MGRGDIPDEIAVEPASAPGVPWPPAGGEPNSAAGGAGGAFDPLALLAGLAPQPAAVFDSDPGFASEAAAPAPVVAESWDPLAPAAADPPLNVSNAAFDSTVAAPVAALPFDALGSDASFDLVESPRYRRRRGRRWLAISAALAVLAVSSALAYRRWRDDRRLEAEWVGVRAGLLMGTGTGMAQAKQALQRAEALPHGDAELLAAQALVEAATAVDLGEDRLPAARKLLRRVGRGDSEWRTAAEGFLALVDDPQTAAGYLKKGTEIYASSALLRHLRGRALALAGQAEAADQAFRDAITLAPAALAPRVAHGVLLGSRPAGLPAAMTELDALVQAHPDYVPALVARSRLRADQGVDLDAAAADAARVTSELAATAGRAQRAWAQLVSAKVARQRNDVPAMQAALDAAVKAAPCCDAVFHDQLAAELQTLHRWSDVATQAAAALRLAPRGGAYAQRLVRALLQLGRPAAAASRLISAPANDPETELLRGWLAYAEGRYVQAQRLLEPLTRRPETARDAVVYWALARARSGESAAALEQLAVLQQRATDDDGVLQAIGRVRLWSGALGEAERALKQAWKLNALDPATPTLLAEVASARHEVPRARQRFARALALRTDYVPARLGLATLLLRNGNVAEARAVLERLAAEDRQGSEYHVVAARLALAAGEFDDAATAIGAARGAGLAAPSLQLLQGQLALGRGQAGAALAPLREARRGAGTDVEVLVALGQAARRSRALGEATEALDAALQRDSGDPDALFERGLLALDENDPPLAVRRLSDALEQMGLRGWPRPRLAPVHTALGRAHLAQGDSGRAIAQLQDAIDLDPAAAEPYYRLALVYQRLDHAQRTSEYLLKAFERDSQRTELLFDLGQTYAKLGDAKVALRYLDQYLGLGAGATRVRAARALAATLRR
ncbi:MAG: tetratricopeptide repeat protein [Proteobacteria bacterium]|nr:tetratricopeptide repeat protein [Pseudomonadota bacterium]